MPNIVFESQPNVGGRDYCRGFNPLYLHKFQLKSNCSLVGGSFPPWVTTIFYVVFWMPAPEMSGNGANLVRGESVSETGFSGSGGNLFAGRGDEVVKKRI
jgi:hypothetical protein